MKTLAEAIMLAKSGDTIYISDDGYIFIETGVLPVEEIHICNSSNWLIDFREWIADKLILLAEIISGHEVASDYDD